MKTKIFKLMAATALVATFAGCMVLSVYPFYNEKDLVFDPGLAGHWAKDGSTNELWEFSAVDGKSYMLSVADATETNYFEAHLFQLKQYQFMDLLTTNRGQFEMPLHLISKVTHDGASLSLHFMDYGWLTSLLQTNPAVLRHIIVPAGSGSETNGDKMLYLTAVTRDLQIFLLKNGENTNAFGSESAVELKRAP